METTIKLFDFKGSQVRIFMNEQNEPEFCALDVVKILGYSSGRDAIARHCKSRGVCKRDIPSASGNQQYTFINEGNLYRLVVKSERPEADAFETWVFEDVLPSIRKHGFYGTPDTLENLIANPDLLIRVATKLKEETAARQAVENENKVLKPKAEYLDALADAPGCITVAQYAKLLNSQFGIDIGRNKLFEWFRSHHYLCSQRSEYNKPYQTEIDGGFMRFASTPITIHQLKADVQQIEYMPLITKKGELRYTRFIQMEFPRKSKVFDAQEQSLF